MTKQKHMQPRFIADHGVVHDIVTGIHIHGDREADYLGDVDLALSTLNGMQHEIELLRAKLRQYEEAKKQEPVGLVSAFFIEGAQQVNWRQEVCPLPEGTNLYAGPAPVPDGWKLAPKGSIIVKKHRLEAVWAACSAGPSRLKDVKTDGSMRSDMELGAARTLFKESEALISLMLNVAEEKQS